MSARNLSRAISSHHHAEARKRFNKSIWKWMSYNVSGKEDVARQSECLDWQQENQSLVKRVWKAWHRDNADLMAEELSWKPITELLGFAFRVSFTKLISVSGTCWPSTIKFAPKNQWRLHTRQKGYSQCNGYMRHGWDVWALVGWTLWQRTPREPRATILRRCFGMKCKQICLL